MSAKALMDEIRANRACKPDVPEEAKKPEANTEKSDEVVTKRRRRRRTAPATGTKSAFSAPKESMFTVSFVGGINLPGYPLKDGERLVVAKLTPIAMTT